MNWIKYILIYLVVMGLIRYKPQTIEQKAESACRKVESIRKSSDECIARRKSCIEHQKIVDHCVAQVVAEIQRREKK